jgi:hypothetical protein
LEGDIKDTIGIVLHIFYFLLMILFSYLYIIWTGGGSGEGREGLYTISGLFGGIVIIFWDIG